MKEGSVYCGEGNRPERVDIIPLREAGVMNSTEKETSPKFSLNEDF